MAANQLISRQDAQNFSFSNMCREFATRQIVERTIQKNLSILLVGDTGKGLVNYFQESRVQLFDENTCPEVPWPYDDSTFDVAVNLHGFDQLPETRWKHVISQMLRVACRKIIFPVRTERAVNAERLIRQATGARLMDENDLNEQPTPDQVETYLWQQGFPAFRKYPNLNLPVLLGFSLAESQLPCDQRSILRHFIHQHLLTIEESGLHTLFFFEVNTTQGATGHPMVSLIIPTYNQQRLLEQCLEAVWSTVGSVTIEVIIIDNGSTDGTGRYLRELGDRVKVVYHNQNLGFLEPCNEGASLALGKYLLFLNNDTVPQSRWLEEMVSLAESEKKVGAVGVKLLYPDGSLQEAGGIIWSDGSGANYGRNDDPRKGKYNLVRDVDYCSAACLLVRRDLFQAIGGFDQAYAPGYFEDSDLCFAIRQKGWRVLYNPKAEVIHLEGASSGRDLARGMNHCQIVNHAKFIVKWQKELPLQHPPDLKLLDLASHRITPQKILILDPLLPEFDRQSGYAKLFRFFKVLREDGHYLTYLPENGMDGIEYKQALEDLEIEVFATTEEKRPGTEDLNLDPNRACLKRLLATSSFSLIYVSFWYTAETWISDIRRYSPQSFVAVDSHDVHFLREERMARLKSDPVLLQKALNTKEREIKAYRQSDTVLTVTEQDRLSLLREDPSLPVMVIPNMHDPLENTPPFHQRKHLLFVGNFGHLPNIDAAQFLCQKIFPHIARRMPGVKMFVVGNKPTPEVLNLASDNIVVTGYVPDLTPYLHLCRVMVAPIRYGAGMKGKIGEAMAAGLPVVTTSMGAEGMNLSHEVNVLVADEPVKIADAVVRVYLSERLWDKLAARGKEHVGQNYSTGVIRLLLRKLVLKAESRIRDYFD